MRSPNEALASRFKKRPDLDFASFAQTIRDANQHNIFCPNDGNLYRMKDIEKWAEFQTSSSVADARRGEVEDGRPGSLKSTGQAAEPAGVEPTPMMGTALN